jgi:hypothetical protein
VWSSSCFIARGCRHRHRSRPSYTTNNGYPISFLYHQTSSILLVPVHSLHLYLGQLLRDCYLDIDLFNRQQTRSRPPRLKMRWTTYLAAAASVVQASTLTPPVLPLLVRNPYLSTWLANAREAPWTRWPIFWTGQEIGFSVLASVPESDTVYPLLGRPHDSLPETGQRFVAKL